MQWLQTLLKLRKDNVQSIEKKMSLLQGELASQEAGLDALREEARQLQLPPRADGAMLAQISMQKSYAATAIKMQQQKVHDISSRLEKLKQEYIEANKEYEQAKYLKADHVKKITKEQKQKDQKFLDELSSQRFYINNTKEMR